MIDPAASIDRHGPLCCSLIAAKFGAAYLLLFRSSLPMSLYLLAVVAPYTLLYMGNIDYAIGPVAAFVGACHVSLALWLAWEALPGDQERSAAWGWLILPLASVAAFLIVSAPTGHYRHYRAEYLLLVGGSAVAAVICMAGAWYSIRNHSERSPAAVLIGVAWFGVSAGLGGISRYWPEGWRVLNAGESAAHVACLLAWWRVSR